MAEAGLSQGDVATLLPDVAETTAPQIEVKKVELRTQNEPAWLANKVLAQEATKINADLSSRTGAEKVKTAINSGEKQKDQEASTITMYDKLHGMAEKNVTAGMMALPPEGFPTKLSGKGVEGALHIVLAPDGTSFQAAEASNPAAVAIDSIMGTVTHEGQSMFVIVADGEQKLIPTQAVLDAQLLAEADTMLAYFAAETIPAPTEENAAIIKKLEAKNKRNKGITALLEARIAAIKAGKADQADAIDTNTFKEAAIASGHVTTESLIGYLSTLPDGQEVAIPDGTNPDQAKQIQDHNDRIKQQREEKAALQARLAEKQIAAAQDMADALRLGANPAEIKKSITTLEQKQAQLRSQYAQLATTPEGTQIEAELIQVTNELTELKNIMKFIENPAADSFAAIDTGEISAERAQAINDHLKKGDMAGAITEMTAAQIDNLTDEQRRNLADKLKSEKAMKALAMGGIAAAIFLMLLLKSLEGN